MAERYSTGDKEKLVRCRMVNPKGEGQTRFVELDNFKLWEYLVTHKHGMTVEDPTICLWVNDEHYNRARDLFEKSGEVTGVNRVTIERYDPNFKFCNLIHRYCLSEETDVLLERLKSHIGEESEAAGNWDARVTVGWVIEPNVGELIEPIALGIA